MKADFRIALALPGGKPFGEIPIGVSEDGTVEKAKVTLAFVCFQAVNQQQAPQGGFDAKGIVLRRRLGDKLFDPAGEIDVSVDELKIIQDALVWITGRPTYNAKGQEVASFFSPNLTGQCLELIDGFTMSAKTSP